MASQPYLVQTVDTHVLVILIGKIDHLINLSHDVDIWVAFGMEKSFTYYHFDNVYHVLCKDKSVSAYLSQLHGM